MNIIHRTLWNPTLNAWVAVSELARSRGASSGGATASRALVLAAAAVLALQALPGQAAGGDGGPGVPGFPGSNGAVGGAGGTSDHPDGGAGQWRFYGGTGGGGGGVSLVTGEGGSGGRGGDTQYVNEEGGAGGMAGAAAPGQRDGGAGGGGFGGPCNCGGGGGGGGGGAFGHVLATDGEVAANALGGKGGTGGDGNVYGGGGGQGGGGVLVRGAGVTIISGQSQGGAGGKGGMATYGGGHGGDGGWGVVQRDGGSLWNRGIIDAGAGGDGGSSWRTLDVVPTAPGLGGEGGVGVLGSDLLIVNEGGIAGGNGGLHGTSAVPAPTDGSGAAGGVGIVGTRVRIINRGVIAGGLSGHPDAAQRVRANAIELYGGDNRLELAVGSVLLGNVVASGANNTLALTGSGAEGSSFTGFSRIETGEGAMWALGGPIAPDGNLTIDTGAAGVLGLSGAVSGAAAALIKEGAGTLVMAAPNNTYGGGTFVRAGTLRLATANALGSGSLSVDAGASLAMDGHAQTVSALQGTGGTIDFGTNGALTVNQATATAFDGDFTGIGLLTKTGTGALTLNGSITGRGTGVAISGGTLVLNAANTYNFGGVGGATLLGDARLVVGNSRALGDSRLTVGSPNSVLGANRDLTLANNIDINRNWNAHLTVDTEVAFTLSGVIRDFLGTGGRLTKTGSGSLTLSGANTYTGGTALKQGRLNLGHDQALGTGALAMDDGTTLGFSADGLTIANAIELTGSNDPVIDTGAFGATLAGAISGGGFITKQGTGTLTLSGANTYTGATDVAQGILRAGAVNSFSAASAHNVAAGATLDLAGFSQTVASLANSGTVSLAGATPGTTLTVRGNYVGSHGVLRLGTVLGEGGTSDRLVIDGGTASGRTTVQIANLGGLGALTSGNGIEVVTAQNGATTTAQTSKDAFALAGGHVDAGAYEYRLHAADASGAGENWYLRSTAVVVPPAIPPTNPAEPAPAPAPAPPPLVVPAYRAEASLHAALPSQLREGSLAMLGDLRRRVGDDDAKGDARGARRAWARVLSTDLDIRQGGTVSPTSSGRLTGVQAGTDLFAAPNWRAGLYVGQIDGDAHVRGFASGLQNLSVGRNDLRSQYLGVYGTFTSDSGFYADAVVQSGRHRATAETMFGAGSTVKGHSLLGSLEIGQAFALGAGGWQIEPQLQLIHQHMDLDNTAIAGAVVQPRADSGWIARAGLRVKGEIATGLGTLQPYGRVNVYRSSSGMDLARFVNGATSTDIVAPTGGTSTELAGGFTLALGPTTSLYGEIGGRWASGGKARVGSSVNGSLGMRVKW
ncbi:outer membrane autotransporter protein [Variovorax sp. TBS-050B]|uniref:autotransporter outer membrane beta-barrel domain-containing protein n=1 Tax=Variovorax sp. TBS-050B TaxID=2940551 RepID=UPI002473694A|nr:autotransporter outer membrane beta-barrel domain-containing protein [Variovorax sp. TBS-050B]MDH6590499.1 outer membrane autotransporter protein [Variovorax sp. TBS-050B]